MACRREPPLLRLEASPRAGTRARDLCPPPARRAALASRYVEFVDDGHFYRCVKRVCRRYAELQRRPADSLLQKSVVDPFKMALDMGNRGISPGDWEEADANRIRDKSLNNAIGEFHQEVLGGVEGWESFPTGHRLGVDLAREDSTAFIELKNKYNTLSGSKKDTLRDTLEHILREHPKATCYWAYILSQDGTSGECAWVHRNSTNPNIRKAWGAMAYGIVTGGASSLSEMWDALPRAMSDITGKKMPDAASSRAREWFRYAFGR